MSDLDDKKALLAEIEKLSPKAAATLAPALEQLEYENLLAVAVQLGFKPKTLGPQVPEQPLPQAVGPSDSSQIDDDIGQNWEHTTPANHYTGDVNSLENNNLQTGKQFWDNPRKHYQSTFDGAVFAMRPANELEEFSGPFEGRGSGLRTLTDAYGRTVIDPYQSVHLWRIVDNDGAIEIVSAELKNGTDLSGSTLTAEQLAFVTGIEDYDPALLPQGVTKQSIAQAREDLLEHAYEENAAIWDYLDVDIRDPRMQGFIEKLNTRSEPSNEREASLDVEGLDGAVKLMRAGLRDGTSIAHAKQRDDDGLTLA